MRRDRGMKERKGSVRRRGRDRVRREGGREGGEQGGTEGGEEGGTEEEEKDRGRRGGGTEGEEEGRTGTRWREANKALLGSKVMYVAERGEGKGWQ